MFLTVFNVSVVIVIVVAVVVIDVFTWPRCARKVQEYYASNWDLDTRGEGIFGPGTNNKYTTETCHNPAEVSAVCPGCGITNNFCRSCSYSMICECGMEHDHDHEMHHEPTRGESDLLKDKMKQAVRTGTR